MPTIEGGGVEKNLFIISNYLSKKISNSILITCTSSFNYKFNNLKIINTKINIKNITSKRLKFLFCILELIKLFLKDKNYLVLSFQANIYCALICRLFGIKVITRSNTSPSGWQLGFFRKIFFYLLLRLPNKIIVNSKQFQKEYKNRFGISVKCIYNPLNSKNISKLSNQKLINNFFKNYKNIKIIFIGRLVEQKDPVTFVKALKILNNKIDFKAIIIGKGIYYEKLKKFLRISNLNKKVKMFNWKINPYNYLKSADMLVLTSRYEGLPNILLEAISLKKYVISSNCPTGPKEILDGGKGGDLFEIGNFKQLADKIYLFSKNKKKYERKIKFAYQRLERFNYNKNLDLYYNEIIKEIN
jgi:glycosyltransferase involved in cell wall biosynthesis